MRIPNHVAARSRPARLLTVHRSNNINPAIRSRTSARSLSSSPASATTTTTSTTATSTFKQRQIPTTRTFSRTRPVLVHAVSLSSIPFIGHFFSSSSSKMSDESFPVQKSDSEWRAVLSREQFRILREKGTEPPNSGEYDKTYNTGTYNCAACDFPLYKSTTKFKSGCGWPAFYEGIPGAIKRNEDKSWGMARTEIVCANCGGHLGHVFKGEGFDTPTDERHCVNSVSLKLLEEKK